MSRFPHSYLLFLALLTTSLLAQGRALQDPTDYRLKVDVNLVLVPTIVTTASGEPLTDLDRHAFEIYEDGQLRSLVVFEKQTAMPLHLALMIDTSLSTMTSLAMEQQSAVRFIRQVLRPRDSAALFEFSGGVHRRAGFTSDFGLLEKGLLKLKPQAGTALYDAIIKVSENLAKREGRRVLVIVSDGTDTTSKNGFHAALRAAQEAEVGIFSLVVRPIPGESGRSVRGEHVLIALGEMTGGQVFFPAGVEDLDRSFSQLSELLRTQYLLGYHPPAHRHGEDFHRIEVRIRAPGDYIVHHRRGFWHRPE